MEIQAVLGSDVAMAFDECPPYPCELEYAAASLERTLRWAQRCRIWIASQRNERRPLLFGIVQGATYRDLREKSARTLVEMEFDGYAIGGVSVGEPESEMMRAIELLGTRVAPLVRKGLLSSRLDALVSSNSHVAA